DEMLLLQAALPHTGFFIGSDRYTNALKATSQGYQVIVMDDGYQHRRLYRNVNILMVDALCPFGYGKILPAGLLRESLPGIKRAHIAVLTRSDVVTPDTISQISNKVQSIKQMPLLTTRHAPSALFDSKGQEKPLSTLQNRKVTAFCSIGNPMGFIATLEKSGANVTGRYFFDDHSEYDQERAGIIRQLSQDAPDQLLVTTEKDWVKLSQCPDVAGIERLLWLRIELDIISGEPELKNLVDNTLNMN
ncbi:MAG: tetraacyldisaccharide 4'-kinase, partial [Sedimentisphaerales bacterium]|nr:tetraacyldisaccharide 4'-kinase [Sedimentisphaerales bacterium]